MMPDRGGESGITGVGAAIPSAIDNAIGVPGAITQLPVTPQRLKELLKKRNGCVARRHFRSFARTRESRSIARMGEAKFGINIQARFGLTVLSADNCSQA